MLEELYREQERRGKVSGSTYPLERIWEYSSYSNYPRSPRETVSIEK
jgi:hypothetical protein